MKKPDLWKPLYNITSNTASNLVTIERLRGELSSISLPAAIYSKLLHHARLTSTHYSTKIEGNRLTLPEAEKVIFAPASAAPPVGRERDAIEVRNYWNARVKVEAWCNTSIPLTERLIQQIHSLVMRNKDTGTSYRDGQNVIKDSGSGGIVYMPPEAQDVPKLMREMLAWAQSALRTRPPIPIPVIAGLLHYQLATIHPYYDGNGRTARLLTHFVMQREGYGLDGLLSLETKHAQDVSAYYDAIATHEHPNYYMGRAKADLTNWLEYFTNICARAFEQTNLEIIQARQRKSVSTSKKGIANTNIDGKDFSAQDLDARARVALTLFDERSSITADDVANILGVTPRMAGNYLREWSSGSKGWLEATTQAKKGRAYTLR